MRVEDVLNDVKLSKFTGRVCIKGYGGYPEVDVEFINGEGVACRGFDERGNIVEGQDCVDLLGRFLGSNECIIEVTEVPMELIMVDINEYPSSVIKEVTEVPETPREEAVLEGFTYECPDPYVLIKVLRSAELWRVIRELRSGVDVINSVLSELGGEASVIYVKFRGDGLECRVLIDVGGSKAYVSCVRDGEEVCGEEALPLLKEVFRESYVMYLSKKS